MADASQPPTNIIALPLRADTAKVVRSALRILFSGYERWLTAVALVLAIGALISNAAFGLVQSGLAWLGIIPLCGLAVYSLLRAHHDEVAELTTTVSTRDTRIAELENRVADLEEVVPVVRFHDPEHDDAQLMVAGHRQSFVFGCVSNNQKRVGHGEVAKDAYPWISVEGLGGEPIISPFKGRWRDAPSPIALPATQHHTHTETIDLRPNGEVRQFDIATKPLEAVRCHVIDAKQNPIEIPVEGSVRVRVAIKGSNFPDVEEAFILANPGHGSALRAWREQPNTSSA